MNRIDRLVVAGLVLVVAIAAIAIAGPAIAPSRSTTPSAPPGTPAPIKTYVEGVLGRPVSANPLAAATQPDRDIVALVFEGLITLDTSGNPRPALAQSWTSTPDGRTWTFHLRPDAHWQDGEPVTADDVVFTIATIQDKDYHGPGAGSWTGIAATATDPGTVTMVLDQPYGGFLDLATQPIAPEHLLGEVGAAAMPDDPFGAEPVGSGTYAVVTLDHDHAVLEPASSIEHPGSAPEESPAGSVDSLATPTPTPRSGGVEPGIRRIELRFFDDPTALASAFRSGGLDAVSGLDPAAAAALAAVPGSRLLREPSTTLTAIALNLRPSHPELADPATRIGLLETIDRSRILAVAYGGSAAAADGLIPPTSWAYDRAATTVRAHDITAATKSLAEAGWKKAKDGWHLAGAKNPSTLELLVPDRTANPILAAVGAQVASDWRTLGLAVNLVSLDPAEMAADRLRNGTFTAAVVGISVGHDPDLYPLLASTQTQTGGANVFGLQDPTLDDLLEKARAPGDEAARKAAFAAVQKRLSATSYVLPIAWPDTVVVLGNRVQGPVERTVSDGSERFWDVLDWRLADDR
jgi:peptide/nickel transport system substrate-binding protein